MNGHPTVPGAGWSNGDLPPQLLPFSQAGKLRLYQNQRRWIGLAGGWSRLGQDGHEHDARTSSSTNTGETVTDPDKAVRSLIAQLCESFYQAGWATGTGGGVSIRLPSSSSSSTNNKNEWRVYVAPSGIQKEDMIAEDIFVLDMDRNIVEAPKTPGLRQSACTPLWYVVYKHRPKATCVIHTHSINAVLATLLDPAEQETTLRLTHLEMLKGVGNHAYDDTLEIPIIDNRPSEDLLAAQLEAAIQNYPKTNAVLVRRHGLYCWGDTWEQAKTQCESYDYLLDCAVQFRKMGVDPAARPAAGTYRDSDGKNEPTLAAAAGTNNQNKKRKLPPAEATDGFHGVGAVPNREDCVSNVVPLLPRDCHYKVLLLDIEGCTTSISFVHDVLFPYARKHLAQFAAGLAGSEELSPLVEGLRAELMEASGAGVAGADNITNANLEELALILMNRDVKSKTLKEIQGRIWKEGYEKGELKGHVYPDFVPMLQWFESNGKVKVYIYSSGSVQAQKLLFGHSVAGDLLQHLAGHFDIPTAGPKKEPASYQQIAASLQVYPADIVFVSDAVGELEAATAAGVGAAVMSVRPGNAPLSAADRLRYPTVHSLLQLCGA